MILTNSELPLKLLFLLLVCSWYAFWCLNPKLLPLKEAGSQPRAHQAFVLVSNFVVAAAAATGCICAKMCAKRAPLSDSEQSNNVKMCAVKEIKSPSLKQHTLAISLPEFSRLRLNSEAQAKAEAESHSEAPLWDDTKQMTDISISLLILKTNTVASTQTKRTKRRRRRRRDLRTISSIWETEIELEIPTIVSGKSSSRAQINKFVSSNLSLIKCNL